MMKTHPPSRLSRRGRFSARRVRSVILGCAFTGVWIALPLLPLTAILLTWLNNL